ncbi:TIM barrel protein [Actinosynnema pretiosum subsp. pretiosum]|uniref:TIM barrel protein n=1 Tax=Actinosynnema pretiosum subsp. pretiosum TaxID=103721 RepID=A0AA45R665_9PSEU|nr:Kinase similar to eukaryotic-like N-acetylglucosamine kinase [Actinosynnema pretiosum subsp. pretiosum]QUF06378.1 TIM barrel protein [Actinosynnema pretiosum subsp. pretiosum]
MSLLDDSGVRASPLWAVDAGGSDTAVVGPGGLARRGSVNPASSDDADAEWRALLADLAEVGGAGWIATATLDPAAPDEELARLRDLALDAGLRGPVVVSNDALPWLVALGGRGVVVVCGTGSGFLACSGDAPPVRVGGCEYLGSDEGSAFDLGLAGLRAAVRGADGRGPRTALTDAYHPSPAALARELADRSHPKAAVAALAPQVCRAWVDGDEVAAGIVDRALDDLVTGARAAAEAAGLLPGTPGAQPFPVAVGGGVPHGCPEFLAELEIRLRAALPVTEVLPVDEPARTVRAALQSCERAGEIVLPRAIEDHSAWLLDLARVPRRREPEVSTVDQTPSAPPVRLGLCLASWGGSGLTAALAAAAGADVVDLPTDTTSGLFDAVRWQRDPRYREETAEALRGARVGCLSNSRDTQLLLGPHGPHTDPVHRGTAEDKAAHARRHAEATLRAAADLGVPQVRLMLGVPDLSRWLSWWHSDVSWSDNVDHWRKAATPLLDLAAELGVTVLVEPHPKQVAYDPASAEALLDATGDHPADVRLCLDVANLAAVGHDPVAAVHRLGDRTAAAHAKDLQRWTGPGDPCGAGWSRYGPGPAIRFRTLGAGELPWPAITAALLDVGFTGALYVEHEDALVPREQGAATSARLLRELLPQSRPQGRTW